MGEDDPIALAETISAAVQNRTMVDLTRLLLCLLSAWASTYSPGGRSGGNGQTAEIFGRSVLSS
jgi:hypothetical protein